MSEQFVNPPIPLLTSLDGWQNVPIFESNEKIVALSTFYPQRIIVKPAYFEATIRGALPECYVRESVAERLVRAMRLLPSPLHFIIWDAWRPVEVQKSLYEIYQSSLAHQHPDWNEDQLSRETSRYVSLPSISPTCPSPHATGGAVDISIADVFGQPVEMGTPFDSFGEKARTRYFEDMLMEGAKLSDREYEALSNRRLLFHALTSAGFTNYHEEWWHYDYGGQFWARIMGQDAIYGPIAPPS